MQNKRIILVVGILIIVVGAAAFIAGRMINQGVGPLGFFGLPGGGGMMSVSIQMTPAPELPTRQPDVTGLFVSRQDNTVTVQSVSMDMGSGGVVVSSGSASEGGGPITSGSPADSNSGPKVEVVVTSDTKIYRDATDMPANPSSGANMVLQQKVETGSLDDLKSQTMVTVWGRKSGDRIIADILFYSNPVMIQKP